MILRQKQPTILKREVTIKKKIYFVFTTFRSIEIENKR